MPSNSGLIWFWIDGTARENWSFPLDIGDSMEVFLDNLKQLNFFFVETDDKIAMIYEVEE